jgi:O-antigen/teichoic acid export membrane protein
MSAIVNDITKQFRAADERPLESQLATKLDYSLTYATSAFNSLLSILAFRIVHQNFEALGFAEYALTRRAIAFLLPLLSLGTTVAIAKCVADASGRRTNASIHFLVGGVIVTLISTLVYALAIVCVPQQVAYVCLGTYDGSNLVVSLLPMLGGMILVNCCSAYCRGRMQVGLANTLQLASVGIIPCGALLLTHDTDRFLICAGTANWIVGIGTCVILYIRTAREKRECHWMATSALLKYGLPRVPGDLAYYGLFVVPAIVVAHRAGLQSAGEVAYAFAWLTILSQLVSPISFLLLPEAAYLIRSDRIPTLRKRLCKILPAFLAITSLLVIVLAYCSKNLIELHLGACTGSLLHNVRLLLWTAIPLNFFICVRSVIDAGESRAVSPALCVIALITFWAAIIVSPRGTDATTDDIYAFATSVCMLAVLGAIATHLVLKKPVSLHDLATSTSCES